MARSDRQVEHCPPPRNSRRSGLTAPRKPIDPASLVLGQSCHQGQAAPQSLPETMQGSTISRSDCPFQREKTLAPHRFHLCQRLGGTHPSLFREHRVLHLAYLPRLIRGSFERALISTLSDQTGCETSGSSMVFSRCRLYVPMPFQDYSRILTDHSRR